MSLPDTIFIFALALVIFGPKKLPEIGRQIGKLVYEFRRASNEFKLQIEEELRSAEEADRQKQFAAQASSLPAASVVSSEMSSESSDALTVHPPTTGIQVSADSPSNSYSSEGEEDWDTWGGGADATTSQAQHTGEAAQEEALEQVLEQSPAPFQESALEPVLEQAHERISEPAAEPSLELTSEPTLEQIFEQSEEPPEEFPEQGFELIRNQSHAHALTQSAEQPLEHAQEQATNHHG